MASELVGHGEAAAYQPKPPVDREPASAYWLLCRTTSHHFALPLANVVETMRMLPVESLAGVPTIVRGLSVIRGVPTPVIDVATLFGEQSGSGDRLVTVRTENRAIAFVADEVVGVQAIRRDELENLPPLLNDVQSVTAIKRLDRELLYFLQAARVVSDDILDRCLPERTNS
jgi:purine-binding chemotaxis protein CheW